MTDQELKDIVAAVVAELEKSGVDFDYKIEAPLDTDTIFVIRGTAPDYQGVTVTWKGLLDIITAQATQAKTDAETAKNAANAILTQVQSKGTEITNFVATSKAEIETQKDESVNAVKSVYQTDLNELKGDLNAESTARQTADNTLQQNIDSEASTRAEADTAIGARIDSETTTRESEVAELERVNAIQKYEIENLKAKAEGKIYREEIIEANAYKLDVPSSVSPYAEVQKIGGKSVVWNQLAKEEINTPLYSKTAQSVVVNRTISSTSDFNTSDIYNVSKINKGHSYYLKINSTSKHFRLFDFYSNKIIDCNDGFIHKTTYNWNFVFGYIPDMQTGTYDCKVIIIDLTQMFGAGNEPTLEECKKIFTADYYPYDEGTLKSFPVKTVKSVGKNLCLAKDVYKGADQYLLTTFDGRECVRFTSGISVRNKPIRFKENTRYTVSFDLKMAEYISGGGAEIVFTFFYTDGTFSSARAFKTEYTNWKRVTHTSQENKTVSLVGVYVNDYRTYCYVSNFQLEEGSVATEYSPYMESTIDLSSVTSELKSAGSVHDEWSNGKKIKRVGERAYTSGDESESGYITDGTTTYYPLATPTEETVPEINNYIQVEGGGTLTFESDDAVHMPVPSTDRFVVDLTSTTEETT